MWFRQQIWYSGKLELNIVDKIEMFIKKAFKLFFNQQFSLPSMFSPNNPNSIFTDMLRGHSRYDMHHSHSAWWTNKRYDGWHWTWPLVTDCHQYLGPKSQIISCISSSITGTLNYLLKITAACNPKWSSKFVREYHVDHSIIRNLMSYFIKSIFLI